VRMLNSSPPEQWPEWGLLLKAALDTP